MEVEKGKNITEELTLFLEEWQAPSPFMEIQTSGSTGIPKRIKVRKEQMLNSARMTCEYLGLQSGDKALLCMPLRYIAGKMMAVRSLYAGLDLIVCEPSGHPLAGIETPIRFAAMTPMQVYNSLQIPKERKRLSAIEILIIGGSAIDRELEKKLQTFPNRIYSTYGMTETLSHIALRRLNGPEASDLYSPLPSVGTALSKEGTLIIEAPQVCDDRLETNDLAEIFPDGKFRIIGRKDNTINSGGIKIQPELLEAELRSSIPTDLAITSAPDPRLGEAVVLLIKKGCRYDSSFPEISPYLRPKHVLEIDMIPQTANGKIDRNACRKLAKRLQQTIHQQFK